MKNETTVRPGKEAPDIQKQIRGADSIVRNWLRLRPNDYLCIVTSAQHADECLLIKEAAQRQGAKVDILTVTQEGIHVGDYFDLHPDIFAPYDVIIGAADYSILTTQAAEKAIAQGKRILSLPLSTNNGHSMLEFDFLTMDVNETRFTAETALGMIGHPKTIHITTTYGTDLFFSTKDRKITYFNGTFWVHHNCSSASFEICCPIVENATSGTLVCDGSFGYIGKVTMPVHIQFKDGRITQIEDNAEGRRLKEYILSYHDEEMNVAGELGIGLNEKSRCAGECYIEDESAYGTFHIGLGRNIGLGGQHAASGHFDLITQKPTIYCDGRCVMEHGDFLLPQSSDLLMAL